MAEQGVLIRISRSLAIDSLGLRGRVDCKSVFINTHKKKIIGKIISTI